MNGPRLLKPKRPWYHLRLHVLLALALIVSAALSWYGLTSLREWRRQTRQETRIEQRKERAEQQQECRRQQESILAKLGSFGPQAEWAGNNVWTLSFQRSQSLADDDLMLVNGLTDRRSLSLWKQTKVTDAGLQHLKALTGLRWLGLSNTQITEAGLEHLKGLTNLQLLAVRDTRVTDAGVKDLQEALPDCNIEH